MLKKKQTIILSAAFIIGLAARLFLLHTRTTTDVDQFLTWGDRILQRGLALGFQGTYFPLEWQIFSFCALLLKLTGLDFHLSLKLISLVFDIGNFFLIIAILKKLNCNPLYSLLYWLHPWFLIIFSLGYVDFQYTFFILLVIYLLLRRQDFSGYLWAGLPLGLAMLMKPQTEIVLLIVFIYALIDFFRNRKLKFFALLIFPFALFLGYEIYFLLVRWPVKGFLKALVILPFYYVSVQNVRPQLTAQMLNFWYLILFFLQKPGTAFVSLSSNIHVLPFVKARILASAVVIALVTWYTFLVDKKNNLRADGLSYLLIFAFAVTMVPFLMTSAHENHFFLGTVLLIPILAKFGGKIFNWAFQGLLAIQFINVYLLYTYDPVGLSLQKYYTYGVRAALAGVSIVLFILVLKRLLEANGKAGIQNNGGDRG
jgi:hypothetical protein